MTKFFLKPNKLLGQNFLTSRKIIEDIINVADLKSDDTVLEIGPGKGILTEALLKKVSQGKVIAIEKDKRLVKYLTQKFHNYNNFQLIHDDILKFSILNFKFSNKSQFLNFKIIANIPYYLTSRFLRQFLQSDFQPTKMVLMVQKEVAERIVGLNGKESILSISVKIYGESKIIKIVPAKYFFPQPKVDSAILLIDNISKKQVFYIDEKRFFELIKKGFGQKRKMLINNLNCNKKILAKCKISEKARPEELSLKNWKCLLKEIK